MTNYLLKMAKRNATKKMNYRVFEMFMAPFDIYLEYDGRRFEKRLIKTGVSTFKWDKWREIE